MIIQYVAEDGKIFEDEDDCIGYEGGLKIKPYAKDIKFFTGDLKEYPLDLTMPYDPYEEGDFMIFKTQEAAEKYSDLMCDYGYINCPTEKGIYYFDEGTEHFINVKETVDEMKRFIAKYEKLLEISKED